jgi:hypothetical protein
MKVGDLVRLKRKSKYFSNCNGPLIVIESAYNAIKVLYPDGRIKTDLIRRYTVINKA